MPSVKPPRPSAALVRQPAYFFDFEKASGALIDAKRSPHTRAAYRSDLAKWISYCRNHQIDPFQPHLEAATLFRDAQNLQDESVRRIVASLSSIYGLLLRARGVRSNPFHPAVLGWPPASGLPKTRMVTDQAARAMIAHAENDKSALRRARDVAILRLLYDTGLRRVSVAALLRSTYVDGTIHAVVKGDKEKELELPSDTVEALDRWLLIAPASPYVFPGLRGHINPGTINKLVKLRGRAVGAGHVHPHSFRAAFATAGYDAGLPEHEVQASLHHSDPKTTRRYDRGARGRTVPTAVQEFRKKRKPT